MEEISRKILYQRIRNRIMEVLEITSIPEEHEKFGSHEIIALWEDWVDDEKISEYIEPEFSKEEQLAIATYHQIWNEAVDNTPATIPSLLELQSNKYWLKLIDCAGVTLEIFKIKGKYSEDHEIT